MWGGYMQRHKGQLAIFFIMAISLLIILSFIIIGGLQNASILSYKANIQLTIVLDNEGSKILSVLRSGKPEMNNMEVLGFSFAKGIPSGYDSDLAKMLNLVKIEAKESGYRLNLSLSENVMKSYGSTPQEGATSIKFDVPVPCPQGGECKGKGEMSTW